MKASLLKDLSRVFAVEAREVTMALINTETVVERAQQQREIARLRGIQIKLMHAAEAAYKRGER